MLLEHRRAVRRFIPISMVHTSPFSAMQRRPISHFVLLNDPHGPPVPQDDVLACMPRHQEATIFLKCSHTFCAEYSVLAVYRPSFMHFLDEDNGDGSLPSGVREFDAEMITVSILSVSYGEYRHQDPR